LDPNFARAHIFFSHLLSTLGRHEEASLQAEKAIELDPLNPLFQALYGVQLTISGRFDEARQQFRQTDEAYPGIGLGRGPYSDLLRHQGDFELALEQAKAHYTGRGDEEVVAALEQGNGEAGYEGAMRAAAKVLEARSTTEYVKAILLVRLYDHAGDIENALRWVVKSFENHEPNTPCFAVMPWSEHLRSDPRFQEVIRSMNLPLPSLNPDQ